MFGINSKGLSFRRLASARRRNLLLADSTNAASDEQIPQRLNAASE